MQTDVIDTDKKEWADMKNTQKLQKMTPEFKPFTSRNTCGFFID